MQEMATFMQTNNLPIDRVEIVGAGVRVPAIKQLIKAVFGIDPSTTLNQDEAVSRGCAIQAAMLSPTLKVKEFQVTDVVPFGIELHWNADRDTKAGQVSKIKLNCKEIIHI